MTFAALVVDRRAALHDGDELLTVQCGLVLAGGREHLFGKIDRGPPVTIGHHHQRLARVRLERQRAPLQRLGAIEQGLDRRLIQAMKHQD